MLSNAVLAAVHNFKKFTGHGLLHWWIAYYSGMLILSNNSPMTLEEVATIKRAEMWLPREVFSKKMLNAKKNFN